MKRIIEISKTYQKGAYITGLIRSIDIMIKWCEMHIKKSEKRIVEPNTPAQIHKNARIKTYRQMLQVLTDRKKNIQERQVR